MPGPSLKTEVKDVAEQVSSVKSRNFDIANIERTERGVAQGLAVSLSMMAASFAMRRNFPAVAGSLAISTNRFLRATSIRLDNVRNRLPGFMGNWVEKLQARINGNTKESLEHAFGKASPVLNVTDILASTYLARKSTLERKAKKHAEDRETIRILERTSTPATAETIAAAGRAGELSRQQEDEGVVSANWRVLFALLSAAAARLGGILPTSVTEPTTFALGGNAVWNKYRKENTRAKESSHSQVTSLREKNKAAAIEAGVEDKTPSHEDCTPPIVGWLNNLSNGSKIAAVAAVGVGANLFVARKISGQAVPANLTKMLWATLATASAVDVSATRTEHHWARNEAATVQRHAPNTDSSGVVRDERLKDNLIETFHGFRHGSNFLRGIFASGLVANAAFDLVLRVQALPLPLKVWGGKVMLGLNGVEAWADAASNHFQLLDSRARNTQLEAMHGGVENTITIAERRIPIDPTPTTPTGGPALSEKATQKEGSDKPVSAIAAPTGIHTARLGRGHASLVCLMADAAEEAHAGRAAAGRAGR